MEGGNWTSLGPTVSGRKEIQEATTATATMAVAATVASRIRRRASADTSFRARRFSSRAVSGRDS